MVTHYPHYPHYPQNALDSTQKRCSVELIFLYVIIHFALEKKGTGYYENYYNFNGK